MYANNAEITITPVKGNKTASSFFITRHSDYQSLASTSYTLKLPTSAGILTIPQLGGSLSLNGRDSKVHVTDYNLGSFNLLYSTAEVFTWKKFADKTVVIMYGGLSELHEAAIVSKHTPNVVEGSDVMSKLINGTVILQWKTSSTRRIVKLDSLFVYLLGKYLWVHSRENTRTYLFLRSQLGL